MSEGEPSASQDLQEERYPIDAAIRQTALPVHVQLHSEPKQVMPFGFSSFAVAFAYYEQFGPPLQLLGIGLHGTLLSSLEQQRGEDVNQGYGLIERIGQGRRIRPGSILGFEPLGFQAMSFHSWLCSLSQDKVSEVLGIRPATNGFISNLADALKVAQYLQAAGAEPAIWLPWLVVRYSLAGY
jgi:hypothetical protein